MNWWEVCTISAILIGHVCAVCTALNRLAVSLEAAGHFIATLSSFRWSARCNWWLSVFYYSLKYMNVYCNGTDRQGRHNKYSWWSSREPDSCCRQVEHVVYETRFELLLCAHLKKKTFVKHMCNGEVVFACQSSCLIRETMERIVVGTVFGRLHRKLLSKQIVLFVSEIKALFYVTRC